MSRAWIIGLVIVTILAGIVLLGSRPSAPLPSPTPHPQTNEPAAPPAPPPTRTQMPEPDAVRTPPPPPSPTARLPEDSPQRMDAVFEEMMRQADHFADDQGLTDEEHEELVDALVQMHQRIMEQPMPPSEEDAQSLLDDLDDDLRDRLGDELADAFWASTRQGSGPQ